MVCIQIYCKQTITNLTSSLYYPAVYKYYAANMILFHFTDYCASKFAVVGLHESLSAEMRHLGKTGIKTTIVCPFFISTGMFEGCKLK